MERKDASKTEVNASGKSKPSIERSPARRGALYVLSDADCRRLGDGNHSDGGGLILQIKGDSRRWYYRFTVRGRTSYVPLGGYPDRKLKDARAEAQQCRMQLVSGIDPKLDRERRLSAEREAAREANAQAERAAMTLEKFARSYHAAHLADWTTKHGKQWLTSLENHIFPKLGSKPLAIHPAELLDVLQPLRVALPETATRIRERLDVIYADAVVRGLCESNPAAAIAKAMRGKRGERRKRRKHHAAMRFADVPAFVQTLRESPRLGVSVALAFEFLILTASRTSEVLAATWSEINEQERTWVIPKERMKAGEPHTVYLSDRALAILREARQLRYIDPVTGKHKPTDVVFPSPQRASRPLSKMCFLTALERLGLWGVDVPDNERVTAHGFRTAFSTWANEQGHFKPDVIEAALAHNETNAVRDAYNRAQYVEQRKRLAVEWSAFCEGAAPRRLRAVR